MGRFKEGAKVIACVNDSEGSYVNGSVGVITRIGKDYVSVDFGDGSTVRVESHAWEIIDYQYDAEKKEVREIVKGSFKQIPLKLGWALTIHKSQGMSIKNVTVDLGFGAFAHGQVYVALSRATSIDGLSLVKPIRAKDLIVDRAVARQMAA